MTDRKSEDQARSEGPTGPARGDLNYEPERVTRRQFTGRALGIAGVLGFVGYAALAPEGWPLSRKDLTGLRSRFIPEPILLDDYRVAKPDGAADLGIGHADVPIERLKMALDAIGSIEHYVQPGDVVLVKPNVAFDRSPNLGATSNPDLLEALIRMLLVDAKASEVRVADNPIESPADCFAKSGVRLAAERAGGRVYLPDSNAFRTLNTPGADLIENWAFFHRPLTNVDKVIGVAPVKDHNLCSASLGLKNWYGLLGGRRNQFHQDIHGIVSDLSLMIKPTLTILDGGHILMKNGPTGGDPTNVKQGDAVVVGLDPVALDAWAFEHLLERGTNYPAYLLQAEHKGSGSMNYRGRVTEIA